MVRPALAAVTLLGAALRLLWLGGTFPFFDDYLQIHEALSSSGPGPLLRALRLNPHHALIDPLSTFVASRFGDGLALLATPSAVAGVAAIPLLWAFAARAGERRALLASLLLALSVLHAQWSRGVNFYALLTALSLVLSILFLRLRARPERWGWYAAAATAFLLAHPYAPLFAPFHLACAGDARARRGLLRAWLVALAVAAPWLWWSSSSLLRGDYFAAARWAAAPSLGRFLLDAPLFMAFAPEAGPHRAWALDAPSAAAVVLAAAYLASLARSLRRDAAPELRYAHALFVYGLGSVVALDAFYGYFYAHRQLLWLLPFYAFGAADGLCALAGRARRPGLALAFASTLLAAAAAPAHRDALRFQTGMLARHEELVTALRAGVSAGDELVFERHEPMRATLYFLDPGLLRAHAVARIENGIPTLGLPDRVPLGGDSVALLDAERARVRDARRWSLLGDLYDLTVVSPR